MKEASGDRRETELKSVLTLPYELLGIHLPIKLAQKMWDLYHSRLLISLIHDFTALRRGRPAPLVAFVDRVSPFSPCISAAWKWEGKPAWGDRLHLWVEERRGERGGRKEKEQVKWK